MINISFFGARHCRCAYFDTRRFTHLLGMLVVLYARTYRLSTPFLKKSRFFIIFLYESLCDWHSLDDAVRENNNAAAQALRGTKACES